MGKKPPSKGPSGLAVLIVGAIALGLFGQATNGHTYKVPPTVVRIAKDSGLVQPPCERYWYWEDGTGKKYVPHLKECRADHRRGR